MTNKPMCSELAALIPKENLPHFWGGPVQVTISKPTSNNEESLLGICLSLPADHRNFHQISSRNSWLV